MRSLLHPRRIVAAAAVGVVSLNASLVLAEEDKATRAARLSREAETLLAGGKTSEACDKLEESQSLDPRGATALDLGLCREKEGRLGSAFVAFEAAEKAALEEKRDDRAATARSKKKVLSLRLSRASFAVKGTEPEGLEVRAGLASLAVLPVVPREEWSKGRPIDAGTVKVVASAPGRVAWESTFDAKPGLKRTIEIPELQVAKAEPAAAAPVAATSAAPPSGSDGESPPAASAAVSVGSGGENTSAHSADRLVIDVGAFGGLYGSLVTRGPVDALNGTPYVYPGPNGSEFLAICGNTTAVAGAGECDAIFDPALAALVGGQLFVGYALTESVQLGARGLFAANVPGGFTLLGGPSISVEVASPLWVGFTLLLGTTQADATVIGARGSVPEESQADNAGEDEVQIPRVDLAGGFGAGGKTATAMGLFEIGGAIEVSYALLDLPSDEWHSGALFVSAWPTGLWSPSGGAAIAVPVGLGYRFY